MSKDEIPDSTFTVLDTAVETLLSKSLTDLTLAELTQVDIYLSAVLDAMYVAADKMADAQPVPGKIPESVLEWNIPGYKEAKTLSDYIVRAVTKGVR